MKHLWFVALLTISLLLPSAVVGQGGPEDEPRNEAVYQGLWCLFLHARPYINDVPPDVSCEYEPRPMTRAEAGAFYQELAQDVNYVIHQWGCAERKSQNGLSWKQDKAWAERTRRASEQVDRQARAVMWPANVRQEIAELLDLRAAFDDAQGRAYGHMSYADSLLSGDWGQMHEASVESGTVAQQVRAALRISDVPDPGNDCKAVKRYERQHEPAPAFDSPYSHPDLTGIARQLAAIGLVESRSNADPDRSLYLTEEGLAAARAMATISDDATADEVVSGLFTLVPQPSPESSPSPEIADME
ncbi:MAG: hypothetical protein PVG27_04330 [Chloroflexota bacterium]|jgi:hypothetical protein